MWNTVGHSKARSSIVRANVLGKVAHAYLITGIEGIGKSLFAQDVARFVNCLDSESHRKPCSDCPQCIRIENYTHTDVFYFAIGNSSKANQIAYKAISMDVLRDDFLTRVNRKPFEGRMRVFIFSGVDDLRADQANILLKTLEEPPQNTMILLQANNILNVLSTISSRCQILELEPIPCHTIEEYLGRIEGEDDESNPGPHVREIARIARGRIDWAKAAFLRPDIMNKRERAFTLIEETVAGDLEDRFVYSNVISKAYGMSYDIYREEINLWLEWWRDLIMVKIGSLQSVFNLSRLSTFEHFCKIISLTDMLKVMSAIDKSAHFIRSNVNHRLVFDNLMLKLPSCSNSNALGSK